MPGAINSRVAAFPPDYRASGLLLHVTSLPSGYGIGDLGPAAFAWIDRLHDAGQSWWQALPLGPTGYGDSPYQALSSFAGNALIISPEVLEAEGLAEPEGEPVSFGDRSVDYESVIPFKHRLLETAWARFKRGMRPDLRCRYEEFCAEQASWLEDYTLFRALKLKYRGVSYLDWPSDLANRHPKALAEARRELAAVMDVIRFAQFLLLRQAERLKAYAHSKGVGLIGDLPFFVSPDSSDVWANPELFLLDERSRPKFVAGVPPDYFSAQGSYGEILSTTGRRFERLAIDGVLIASARFCRTWTWFVWIISGDSRRPGTFRRERPRPRQDRGSRGRAPSSSKPSKLR
jgi:4-alpha-glucanotransferase